MNKLIEKTLEFFELKERDPDRRYIVLKDNAPESLKESIRDTHGDRLPDDWIYDKYHSALETLSGYDINDENDINDNRAEIVDGLVDVYTSNLTQWLNSNNSNVYYITEAQEEYGPEADGFKILMMAQYKAIDEIFTHVAKYLTETRKQEIPL